MKKIIIFLNYSFLVIIMGVIAYGYSLLYTGKILSLGYILLIAVYTINIVISTFVFTQTRHSRAKLSWLMIFALAPIFGQTLFILFGGRYKGRQNIQSYQNRDNFKYEILKKNDDKYFESISQTVKRGIYKGDLEFIGNGNDAYNYLFEDLKNAKKFIHLNYYIIKSGEIYDEIINILKSKVKQGVEVRVIVDDFGRWAMSRYETKTLIKSGIQVAIFGKVHFPFLQSENGYRTHRKMTIIDGTVCYTGGLNIADEYASLRPKYGMWVDINARVTGKAIRSFSLLFIEDWYQYTGKKLETEKYLLEGEGGSNEIILVEDSPEIIYPLIQNTLIKMILNARHSIALATPYFVPTNSVISALRTAALSGVKIDLFIPGKPDKQIPYQASKFFALELMEYGVNVYKIKNIFLHSKIGVFDEKYVYFGTANLDIRSLYSQFEMLSIFKGRSVKKIIEVLENYKKISVKIKIEDLHINWVKKFFVKFYVNLFSPMI